jgi:uncharacterized protein (TIGR02996 family)
MSTAIESVEAELRSSPTDQDTWKVYADWLLAQGDRRGELIVLEALAASQGSARLHEEIATLTAAHEAEWQPAPLSLPVQYESRHGFVRAATLSQIERPSDLRALAQLLADPQARLLTDLQLRFARTTRAKLFAPLAELDLGRLTSLQAAYFTRGDSLVSALTRQPVLRLQTLDLRHARLTNTGLRALAGCEQLRGLRALHLQNNAFGPAGIEELARSPVLSELEILDLRYDAIGMEGVRALAASPMLGKLRSLQIYAGEFDRDSIRALASSPNLPHDIVRFWRAVEDQR